MGCHSANSTPSLCHAFICRQVRHCETEWRQWGDEHPHFCDYMAHFPSIVVTSSDNKYSRVMCHAMTTIAASEPIPCLHTCKLAFPHPEDFQQAGSKHLRADSPTLTEGWNSFACTCAQGLLDFASQCSRVTQRSHVHAAMPVSGGTPHPSAQFRVHQHL